MLIVAIISGASTVGYLRMGLLVRLFISYLNFLVTEIKLWQPLALPRLMMDDACSACTWIGNLEVLTFLGRINSRDDIIEDYSCNKCRMWGLNSWTFFFWKTRKVSRLFHLENTEELQSSFFLETILISAILCLITQTSKLYFSIMCQKGKSDIWDVLEQDRKKHKDTFIPCIQFWGSCCVSLSCLAKWRCNDTNKWFLFLLVIHLVYKASICKRNVSLVPY